MRAFQCAVISHVKPWRKFIPFRLKASLAIGTTVHLANDTQMCDHQNQNNRKCDGPPRKKKHLLSKMCLTWGEWYQQNGRNQYEDFLHFCILPSVLLLVISHPKALYLAMMKNIFHFQPELFMSHILIHHIRIFGISLDTVIWDKASKRRQGIVPTNAINLRWHIFAQFGREKGI